LNNKLTSSTKKSSAIFLATVLIAGTIAAISPSFMVGAQAQQDYGMDNRYNSYEPEPEYPPQYAEKEYNSYKPEYGMDNSYESQYPSEYKDKDNYRPDYPPKYTDDRKYNSYKSDHYGMDNDYDKKTYGYESKYQSYGKDDKDKSKDITSVNKIKCINTNLNINGNNTGDSNVGNKGAAEEGYVGAYSSGGGGYNSEGYDNGYKQGKGFDCIINNNNTNTNVSAGAGNVTDDNVTEATCEECFERFLTPDQIFAYLRAVNPSSPPTFNEYCNTVGPGGFAIDESEFRSNLAGAADVEVENIDALIACLANLGIQFIT